MQPQMMSASARGLWIEIVDEVPIISTPSKSASARGLWIEIERIWYNTRALASASARGLWIEIL